jgi:tetratricopeptide (TPR) repeat protein
MSNEAPHRRLLPIVIGLVLVIATAWVYWNVQHFYFVSFDDDMYIFENPMTLGGLTARSVVWAFTSLEVCNWHPLTWFSHIIDVELYGVWAGGHHITSVVIHIMNAILVFMLLYKATGETWKSALVAAVFALHPMHVESVAWVAERKDVLSMFFILLSMHAYRLFFIKGQRTGWYIASLGAFLAALMAKPIAVVFPAILIAFDIWPLQRLRPSTPVWKSIWKLTVEKAPFIILSAVSAVIAVIAQNQGGAVTYMERFGLWDRITHAMTSYITYIYKMLIPTDLGLYYLHDTTTSPGAYIPAALLLVAATVLAFRWIHKQPWFMSGWLIYLVALLPVIGIVQVGAQSMADRYAYIPMLGLSVIAIWSLGALTESNRTLRIAAQIMAVVVIAWYTVLAQTQVQVWHDNQTLYSNTLRMDPHHPVVNNNLGTHYLMRDDPGTALGYFRDAVNTAPGYATAIYNIGLCFHLNEVFDSAVIYYDRAIAKEPGYADAWLNAGVAYYSLDQYAKSETCLINARRLAPASPLVEYHFGILRTYQHRYVDATTHFETAIRLDPALPDTYLQYGRTLKAMGDKP